MALAITGLTGRLHSTPLRAIRCHVSLGKGNEMSFKEVSVPPIEDDGMASYGLHPSVHEQLLRCHNQALFKPGSASDPLESVRSKINQLMAEGAAGRRQPRRDSHSA